MTYFDVTQWLSICCRICCIWTFSTTSDCFSLCRMMTVDGALCHIFLDQHTSLNLIVVISSLRGWMHQ